MQGPAQMFRIQIWVERGKWVFRGVANFHQNWVHRCCRSVPQEDAGTRLRQDRGQGRSGDPRASSPWADRERGHSSGLFLTRGSSDPDLS